MHNKKEISIHKMENTENHIDGKFYNSKHNNLTVRTFKLKNSGK